MGPMAQDPFYLVKQDIQDTVRVQYRVSRHVSLFITAAAHAKARLLLRNR